MPTSAHHPPNAPLLLSCHSDTDTLVESLASFIAQAQRESIDKKGKFTVALSGGSLPKLLRGLIDNSTIKWRKWHVYYVDERVVPLNHADSNHRACVEALFSKVPIPQDQIHPIDESLLDDLEELSDSYEKELIKEFAHGDAPRFPIFDLILLGMDPDGHTASLFPGHELLSEGDRWAVCLEDSPKPPPKRITLTIPVINHASRIAFVVAGGEKADALKAVLDDRNEGLSAACVKPVFPGQLYWFTDEAAAAKASFPRSQLPQRASKGSVDQPIN